MQEDSKLLYILKRIWPTTYRLINGAFYFVIMIIKAIVNGAIEQIRHF